MAYNMTCTGICLLARFPCLGGNCSVTYDELSPVPSISIDHPDGAIELRGIEEIDAAVEALARGARLVHARIH